jgi:hypothetical protein
MELLTKRNKLTHEVAPSLLIKQLMKTLTNGFQGSLHTFEKVPSFVGISSPYSPLLSLLVLEKALAANQALNKGNHRRSMMIKKSVIKSLGKGSEESDDSFLKSDLRDAKSVMVEVGLTLL